jgi:hypothetical protein
MEIRSFRERVWRAMRIIGIALLSSIVMTQCGQPALRSVNWHFVIPDQYEGFLAIEYACAGGVPLPDDGTTIQIVFDDTGTFCTTDPSFGWEGQYTIETRSGQSVPTAGGVWRQTGYGFYGSGLMTFGDSPRRQFSIYWAGDRAYLAQIRNTAVYGQELAAFLRDRFGVVRPNS